MDEITLSLTKQLHRRFGDQVACRFVDIHELETAGLSRLLPEIQAGRSRLPLILIDGIIRFRGLFSPTFIQRDINTLLAKRKVPELSSKKTTTLSNDQLRRLRMRQFMLATRAEQPLARLTHIPHRRET